jgi:hypothetical protein
MFTLTLWYVPTIEHLRRLQLHIDLKEGGPRAYTWCVRTRLRNQSELPSLRRFGRLALLALGIAWFFEALFSAITYAPSARSLEWKMEIIPLISMVFLSIVVIRTQTIIWQTRRQREQTFDRPCPEWTTVAYLLSLIGAVTVIVAF